MAKQTEKREPMPETISQLVDSAPRTSLEEAMEIIEVYVKEGAHFTNQQLDVFAEAMLAKAIPPEERAWVRECATQNHFPLWLSFMAHYRKAQEWGNAATLFTDAGWEKIAMEK